MLLDIVAKKFAELMLENGANTESRDNSGWTPLHFAIARGDANIVSLLIQKGADLESRTNDSGDSSLMIALRIYDYQSL